jgi:hypothetical protein
MHRTDPPELFILDMREIGETVTLAMMHFGFIQIYWIEKSFKSRVTRWAYEKIALNVAQTIFVKINA